MDSYDLLLENALDAVVGVDQNEKIIYWNLQAEEIFGWKKSEAFGQIMSSMIVPERLRIHHKRGMQRFIETGEGHILNQRIEVPASRKDGTEFPSELTVSALKRDDHYLFFSFIRDVTRQKETENERLRLLDEAQNAVKARDEFIGICSHELKTPVTSLSLQFQIAEKRLAMGDEKILSPEASLKRIQMANRQIGRLTRLIDDMLDMSRISVGKMHYSSQLFELNQLITEVVERFQNQEESESTLLSWVPVAPVEILGDRDRIEQVIINLLTNSLKYGNHQPVMVSLEIEKQSVNVLVKDQGLGIAPENIQRIFEKFERGVSSNEISGMGIGLYITRTIVEAHQGKISVESELGKGSIFKIILPKTMSQT